MSKDYTSASLANLNDINNKVDKETGKGLSSNDFTDSEKDKLSGLPSGSDLSDILSNKAPLASPALTGTPTAPTATTGTDTTQIATTAFVNASITSTVGTINSTLDAINGEVV